MHDNIACMTKFDSLYQDMLKRIMKEGVREKNARTGHVVCAVPGMHFSIDIEKEGFPILTLRKIPIKMFVAEQIWFVSGARKPADFLRDFTKIWDAASDGLGGTKKANVPCPYTFTVNIIGGRLHLHNMVRSNDMVLGFPADVAGFALLQCILAQKLGVGVGVYSHSISNAHMYDNQYEAVEEMLKRTNDHAPIKVALPKNNFDRAEKKDVKLVEEIAGPIMAQYHPLSAIGGLQIVL